MPGRVGSWHFWLWLMIGSGEGVSGAVNILACDEFHSGCAACVGLLVKLIDFASHVQGETTEGKLYVRYLEVAVSRLRMIWEDIRGRPLGWLTNHVLGLEMF